MVMVECITLKLPYHDIPLNNVKHHLLQNHLPNIVTPTPLPTQSSSSSSRNNNSNESDTEDDPFSFSRQLIADSLIFNPEERTTIDKLLQNCVVEQQRQQQQQQQQKQKY